MKRYNWNLCRYARYVNSELTGPSHLDDPKAASWKQYGGRAQCSLISEPAPHFVITQDSTCLENLTLLNASQNFKAFIRGDCMLFICKLKNESRRFRIKFDSGTGFQTSTQACTDCAEKLKKYMPVKPLPSKSCDGRAGSDSQVVISQEDFQQLEGEVPLSRIVQVLLRRSTAKLPLAYQHTSLSGGASHGRSSDDLDQVVKLCLMDTEFPAFVDAVEKTMLSLISEG